MMLSIICCWSIGSSKGQTKTQSGIVGDPVSFFLTPSSPKPPALFHAMHANWGSRAAHLCPAGTDSGGLGGPAAKWTGECRDPWMLFGVVIFCDLRQSQAP